MLRTEVVTLLVMARPAASSSALLIRLPVDRRSIETPSFVFGALDYLEWPYQPSRIMTAIELAEGAAASIGSLRLREARARSRVQKLTRREREVMEGVADGLSNRMIGERLRISPRTVEIHRANMLNKMGASHTSEAIRIAIEASIVA